MEQYLGDITVYKALLSVQKTVGAVKKDSVNPFFKSKYVSLGGILEILLPALHENGFILMQPIERDCDTYGVRTILLWTGEKGMGDKLDCGFIPLLECKDPQAQGKAISYNRRYGILSALGLWADDDDGESAMNRPPVKPRLDNKGAVQAPPFTPNTEANTKAMANAQERAVTPKVTPVAPVTPDVTPMMAKPEPVVSNEPAFDYQNNEHRALLTKAVKASGLTAQQLTPVRTFFTDGKWKDAAVPTNPDKLCAFLKEIAG